MKVNISMFKTLTGLVVGIAMALVPVATTHAAGAASLSLSPAGGTYTNGTTFAVGIYEDSSTNDADSASANLTYDAGKLQAMGISGGVFTTCATNPSANAGTISTGDCTVLGGKKQGKQLLATVTFKAIVAGTAAVNFTSGKVVNAGADLAVTTSNGSFTITTPAPATPPTGGMGSGSSTPTTTTTTSGHNTTVAPNTAAAPAASTTPAAADTKAATPDVKGATTKEDDTKNVVMAKDTAAKKHSVWPWVILVAVAAAAVAYAMRNRATAKPVDSKDDADAEVVKPADTAKAATTTAAVASAKKATDGAVQNKRKSGNHNRHSNHKKPGNKNR